MTFSISDLADIVSSVVKSPNRGEPELFAAAADLSGIQPDDEIWLIGARPLNLENALVSDITQLSDLSHTDVSSSQTPETHKQSRDFIRALIRDGLVSAVQPVGSGGITAALVDMLNVSRLGGYLIVETADTPEIGVQLFGESEGAYLISLNEASEETDVVPIPERAIEEGVELALIGGSVEGPDRVLEITDSDEVIASIELEKMFKGKSQ